MAATSLHELIPVLQVAIGPVILISGVGLVALKLELKQVQPDLG